MMANRETPGDWWKCWPVLGTAPAADAPSGSPILTLMIKDIDRRASLPGLRRLASTSPLCLPCNGFLPNMFVNPTHHMTRCFSSAKSGVMASLLHSIKMTSSNIRDTYLEWHLQLITILILGTHAITAWALALSAHRSSGEVRKMALPSSYCGN
ncbi:hypothetical protein E2C01_028344 [Portunus trituberculatus]|uniref:Uncharacterized protein n=1 Tax=Portunus trituberculatus TaxID=210409 RepID=A0A5B7EK78_PORTR|nr:hypothetical protein [Portunus trituberculatus]